MTRKKGQPLFDFPIKSLLTGDLREEMLNGDSNTLYLIGQNVIEQDVPTREGDVVSSKKEKKVELVWAKVYRTQG